MAWRFNRRIKIAPGIRLNIGKSGITSVNLGRRGSSVSLGKTGTHLNLGVPGTGLSRRTKISGAARARAKSDEPSGAAERPVTGGSVYVFMAVAVVVGVIIGVALF
ncbi:DUF4236 domain-containing protein [Pararhodobacter oceanensis]|uniref:DUF4236 domain-containing protein n=1 Tax=Pararhodobacter oceanensis TaxID=2172121 RepID=UPI003A956D75